MIRIKNPRVRTKNPTELQFISQAKRGGYTIFKRGWPDFLIVKDDAVFGVEVKTEYGEGSKLSKYQESVATILARFGLRCFVWRPESGFERINEPIKKCSINGIPPF